MTSDETQCAASGTPRRPRVLGIQGVLPGFLRLLTVVAALSMLPVALVIALFLPLDAWTSLALTVLPAAVFIVWLVRAVCYAALDRKASPVAFYATVAVSLLFLLLVADTARFVYVRGLLLRRIPQELLQLGFGRPVGLFADRYQRRRLLQDCLRMEVLHPLFAPAKDRRDAVVLDYTVRNYDLDDVRFLFHEIFVNQEYFFVADSQRPLVIDCGSHIGMSILYFKALYPDAQVVGFEPAPGTFQLLSENIERNGLRDVTLLNKALADKEGSMTFYGDDSLLASLFQDRTGQPRNATEVPVARLSKYIDRPVDLLKIDVEGAEGLVLEDLAAAKKLAVVKQMIIEYHHHMKKDVDALSKFLRVLEDRGFGYQIESSRSAFARVAHAPNEKMAYEDVMIFAYQKRP